MRIGRWLGLPAQCTVVTCHQAGQTLIRGGLPAHSLAVIPCAAPVVAVTAAGRRQLREELGLPANARLIGATGPLIPRSRLKDLIWAADLLKVLYDDVHLLIVGEGPQRWRLQRFCRQIEAEDRVHLLGDRLDMPRLISCTDCFWAGSPQPGQTSAILAAMGAGIPVLAPRVPWVQDLVIPERTGYLFPVGNLATLVRRTKCLLDNPELARRLGDAGRQAIEGRFRVDAMVQRYVSLYAELLAATDKNDSTKRHDLRSDLS